MSSSSTPRMLLASAGVLALGAALWWLTEDHEEKGLADDSTYTIEKLRDIVHEIFIEGATIYCQKLN